MRDLNIEFGRNLGGGSTLFYSLPSKYAPSLLKLNGGGETQKHLSSNMKCTAASMAALVAHLKVLILSFNALLGSDIMSD